MSAIHQLLTDHIEIWTAADTEKKSGRGRSSGNAASVYGIKKLRELILELAVRGKLVPQDPNDEPASELLKRIQAEKAKLIAEGKIKKAKPLSEITNDEQPFELPKGWEWVRLGEVIDYVNGFAFSSKDFATQGIGVVKIGDIQQGKIEPELMSRVSKDVVDGVDARFQVINGDLVIAMSGATTGKLGFNDTEEIFYLNQRVGKIVPFIISKKFLYFDLTSKIADNLKKSFGSAIPNLSTEQINAIVTALPPIEEQHRIVAKVDELMALCDQLETQHSNAAEAHEKLVSHLLGTLTQSPNTVSPLCKRGDGGDLDWQRIAAHFDTLFTTEASIDALKQTLLQLAVMGKLVPQDPNDEPASELLKRIQAEKAKLIAEGKIKKDKPLPPIIEEEKPFDLPEGWEWTLLGQLVIKVSDGPHFSPKYVNKEEGVPFISSRNIKVDGWELDSAKYVSHSDHKEFTKRTKAEVGDILYTKGGTTGVAIVNDLDFEFSVWVHVAVLNIFQRGIFNHYFSLALNSPHCYAQSQKFTHGISNKDLGLTRMVHISVPLPPLAEQHRIVAKVDELMTICDQLKARITEANQLQQKLADVLVEQALS